MSIDRLLAAIEAYSVSIREVAHETGSLMIDNALRKPDDPENFVDSVRLTDTDSRAMAPVVVDGLADSPESQSLMGRAQDIALSSSGKAP